MKRMNTKDMLKVITIACAFVLIFTSIVVCLNIFQQAGLSGKSIVILSLISIGCFISGIVVMRYAFVPIPKLEAKGDRVKKEIKKK